MLPFALKIRRWLCVSFLALVFSSSAEAVDKTDIYSELFGSYHVAHKNIGSTVVLGYGILNDIGLGFVLDQNPLFIAPSLEFRWFVEPFEFAFATGALFWAGKEDEKEETFFHFSFHSNYLVPLTPSMALMFAVKGHFIDEKFRTTTLGLGGRFLF